VVLEQHSEPIGGPGKVVEIDVSKLGKRKYHCGKRVERVWVFGGIERDSSPIKCFFTTVHDRSGQHQHSLPSLNNGSCQEQQFTQTAGKPTAAHL